MIPCFRLQSHGHSDGVDSAVKYPPPPPRSRMHGSLPGPPRVTIYFDARREVRLMFAFCVYSRETGLQCTIGQ